MGLGQSLSISFRGSTWALCFLPLLLLSFLLNKGSFWDGTAIKAFKKHSIKCAGPYCSFLVTFFITVPPLHYATLSLIFSKYKYFRRKCQPCPSFFRIKIFQINGKLSLDQMKKKERVKVKS